MQFLGCISIRSRMGLNQFHSIVSNSVKLSSRGYTHAVCGRSQIGHTLINNIASFQNKSHLQLLEYCN